MQYLSETAATISCRIGSLGSTTSVGLNGCPASAIPPSLSTTALGRRLACFTSWNTSARLELVTGLKLMVAVTSSVGFFGGALRSLQAKHKKANAVEITNREVIIVFLRSSFFVGTLA